MSAIISTLERSSVYQRLSHNPEIIEVAVPSPEEVVDMPDVDMDHYAITSRGKIATSGIHTCFAVCCQGRRSDLKAILGLAHASVQSIHAVCQTLSWKLLKRGCDPTTIKTYVVGGMLTCEDGATSCLDQEIEVLHQAKRDNIVGVRFNVAEGGNESLSLIFTPDVVRFSKQDLFQSTDTIGTPLDM
jgi:hypothetical protein